jgi:hypothetical protein
VQTSEVSETSEVFLYGGGLAGARAAFFSWVFQEVEVAFYEIFRGLVL